MNICTITPLELRQQLRDTLDNIHALNEAIRLGFDCSSVNERLGNELSKLRAIQSRQNRLDYELARAA